MGACHCSLRDQECSLGGSSPHGELQTQAFSAVFSPQTLPAPCSSSAPDVEHFDVGHERFIERHGGKNYLVVQADNRAMADRIVAEFEHQRSRHLSASTKPLASREDASGVGLGTAAASRSSTAPGDAEDQTLHTYGSGATYLGEWSGELRHGHGIQTWPSGLRYEGQWVHDMADGEGRLVRACGDLYEGQFRADRLHGQGRLRPVCGASYAGQWEDDLQHGHGDQVRPDGVRYVGQFRAGARSGRGRLTWPNGAYYEGGFEDDAIHGFGFHEWADGRSYRGQWSKEKMHGAGVFSFPDGRSYEGQYVNDLKHGFGMFSWPDGRQYEGQWREGKQHGLAVYHTAAGEVRAGEWDDGKWLCWTGKPGEGQGEGKLPRLLERAAAEAEAVQQPPQEEKSLVSPRLPAWIARRS